jgi:hypothetical protein
MLTRSPSLLLHAEKRKKQFALLFECIDDLERTLRAEEDDEVKEGDSQKEPATGKRKRLTEEEDTKGNAKATTDDPPAPDETVRKRVRETDMEEEAEPGEITATSGMATSPGSQLYVLALAPLSVSQRERSASSSLC